MHTTPADAHLLPGDRAEELASLQRLLAQLDGDTDPEHADRRRRLAAAIRGVLAKHAA